MAVEVAHVAAEVIAGELQGNEELAAAAFNARVIPSVAHTDPEIAWVGLTETEAKAQGIKIKKKACSPGTLRGVPLQTAVMKASPNCCLTTAPRQDQETAMLAGATARFWAAASLVPTRAT